MRFITQNLCSENATVRTASSSNTNFPVSNLANPLRSKRWRSSGNFDIDSTNNKIDFKELSGGMQITASLTTGTYTTTTLRAEIKTRLEALGFYNYAVTYGNATGIWTIVSDGLEFILLNETGTNAATSLLVNSLGFPATDMSGSLTYSGSVPAIHTKEWVKFDFRTSQDITGAVLLWPKEDGIRLSPSAVITLEGNATDVWTSPAVSQVLEVSNTYMVASHFFATPESLRYWRLTFVDPLNPYLYVELGVAFIGEDLGFAEAENGFKLSITDQTDEFKTDFGHRYFDEYPMITTLEFNYSFIEYTTAQALENAYRTNGISKPVLVVFDEGELAFDKDHLLIYGTFEKRFDLNHVSFNMFKGGQKITELG